MSKRSLIGNFIAMHLCLPGIYFCQSAQNTSDVTKTVSAIFSELKLVRCESTNGVIEEATCSDDGGNIIIQPGRTLVFRSALKSDDTVQSIRNAVTERGCQDLWSDLPEGARHTITWAGTLYYDAFECNGVPMIFHNNFTEDGSAEYLLRIFESKDELMERSPLEWRMMPPRTESEGAQRRLP